MINKEVVLTMLEIPKFMLRDINITHIKTRVAHVPISFAFVDKNHRSNQLLIEDFKLFETL